MSKKKILCITKPYGLNYIGIFGSYARNEQSDKSDLDILIDLDGQIDLLGLIGLEQQLADEPNLRVDLITYRSLNKLIKPYIESDLVQIY